AQMAVFVSRSICTPTGEAGMAGYTPPTTPTFPDVSTDYWAYKYIEYAAEHNVVGGYPEGLYRPNEPVNRGQMAVFIARALVTPSGDAAVLPGPAEPTFPDVTSSNAWSWCYDHVEHIAEKGVTQGYAYDGNYHPEYICSRDQMAVYIQRAFNLPM
ncbi:MAG TPA: S-layer homology domain-containing protein, partial [Anaerolineae bacterium]|nr:S-layer homology domain-containing protein [Anaerolineae bacterium]